MWAYFSVLGSRFSVLGGRRGDWARVLDHGAVGEVGAVYFGEDQHVAGLTHGMP